jgi:deoxyribodipyrimidine photo-lyase
MTQPLPAPTVGNEHAWVTRHLGDLACDDVGRSSSFRGGQGAADAALASFDIAGYAANRNEVYPRQRRGASRLSPYVRHGLITLPRLWQAVAAGPARDVSKFRDELLWQEYARHLYARTRGSASCLRGDVPAHAASPAEDWRAGMTCLDLAAEELRRDGWLVNQARMWFASHWSVRTGLGWRDGEDLFFAHLLDGSRAANRLGWQWTVGAATGQPYGFARAQVERRAPGLCVSCGLRGACPIQHYPDQREVATVPVRDGVAADPDPEGTGGPREPVRTAGVRRVWLTAESLGDDDPALSAQPHRPAVFVFDEALLARLRLTGKRLVFLAECLADLAARRELEVFRGDPVEVLRAGGIAATFTPVPGWHRRAQAMDIAELHPWPWLVRPVGGPAGSFSAWRKAVGRDSRTPTSRATPREP